MMCAARPGVSAEVLSAAAGASKGHSGRLRWAVNSTRWLPRGGSDGSEFQFLLSLIDASDSDQIGKFCKEDDRKRALLSRLMARQASATVLGLRDFTDIRIARTFGKKPYLKAPRPSSELANFNFNVSHEGDWVVLASEPRCVCGVDVSAPEACRPGARTDVFDIFEEQLSPAEWEEVRRKAAEAGGGLREGPGRRPRLRAS